MTKTPSVCIVFQATDTIRITDKIPFVSLNDKIRAGLRRTEIRGVDQPNNQPHMGGNARQAQVDVL